MRVVLMRHADAATIPGTSDHERPLTSQGERDAISMGQWLRMNVRGITAVLASDAARVRRTAELVREQFPELPEPIFSADLYRATRDDLLDLVQATDDDDVLLVIAHNPAVAQAAQALTDGQVGDFSAGAVAVLDVAAGKGRVLTFIAP